MDFFPVAALEQCNANMRYIIAEEGCETLAQLERRAYKDTAAGVSVSWRLLDGSILWPGEQLALNPAMVDRVCEIGVSCIIEGSDAEVPVRWLNLVGLTPEEAYLMFDDLCGSVSAEAGELADELGLTDDDAS